MTPSVPRRSSHCPRHRAWPLLLVLLAVTACGGSGPTETGGDGGNGGNGDADPSIESVEVTPSSGEIDAVDGTIEFSAVARDADGDPVDGTTFDWASTNEAAATVDDAGVATAVANGQTTIQATAEGVTGEADLTVEQVPVQVTVSPADDTLTSEGETRQFDASSEDANGHPVQDVTYAWSSSMEAVATVDGSGLATAEGEGETQITATSDPGGVEGSQLLVVDLPEGPQGDAADVHDVVINEVNWFGNGSDAGDEWIELRNVSGAELNLSGWTLDAAGTGTSAVVLDEGTVLGDGAYLVIAARQGADQDGQRTSLTGVSGVQIQPVGLSNSGEQLILRDVEGSQVDATPTGGWPAGDDATLESMERRDDLTGGGYTSGEDALAWYTWNAADGTDTTSPATADSGTPGADNTDPDATTAGALPYLTSFETGEPAFVVASASGALTNDPPPGTSARSGTRVVATAGLTTGYAGRQLETEDCLALTNDVDPVTASLHAMAGTGNGGNTISARLTLRWFTDATCGSAHPGTPETVGTGLGLTQGSYSEVAVNTTPPSGATHLLVRLEVRDDDGAPNDGETWAADDVLVQQ